VRRLLPALALSLLVPAASAGGDSFTPVRLSITVARAAKLHRPLAIRVAVSADAGVLDTRTAPLRIRVKLSPECGGVFQQTPGAVLLDKRLAPQPVTGRPYAAVARGSGRPNRLGTHTVCAWLAEEGDGRVFASDQSLQVRVTKPRPKRRTHRAVDSAPAAGATAIPPIRHVFVIVLENESAATTFGAGSPAPYLSKTLRAAGAYLPKYYGTGHESNDNYIAMISGQAPNLQTQTDCQIFGNLVPGTLGAYGQAEGTGCVYPASVPTIVGQLDAAGYTWRDYNEQMGADPVRESSECGHPGLGNRDNTESAEATDNYATRHNPFVYFHSIIDDTTLCDTHVVNLDLLPADLASPSRTPNYVFITPDLCSDGHDAKCADGTAGGLPRADAFLRQWVPRINGSPAFREQNGLLIVTFDEASTSDASACCGEIAGPGAALPGLTGPGGGDTGTVLLSPCIAPGTVSTQPYNHYAMLRSVEDIFGLPHLGYAQLPGERSFGSDVFTRPCDRPPTVVLRAPARVRTASARARVRVSWSSGTGLSFTVQLRPVSGAGSRRWQTLLRSSGRRSLVLRLTAGRGYRLRVRATDGLGRTGGWVTVVIRARRVRG
jgi:hypothetical protein